MHDVRVMLSREYVSCAPHIGRQLVDFIKLAVNHRLAQFLIAQVADDKIVRFSFVKLRKFQVNTSNPEAFRF
jgi:hypothetical protein